MSVGTKVAWRKSVNDATMECLGKLPETPSPNTVISWMLDNDPRWSVGVGLDGNKYLVFVEDDFGKVVSFIPPRMVQMQVTVTKRSHGWRTNRNDIHMSERKVIDYDKRCVCEGYCGDYLAAAPRIGEEKGNEAHHNQFDYEDL